MSINGVSGASQKSFGDYTAAASSYNAAAINGGIIKVDLGGGRREQRSTVPTELPGGYTSEQ